MIVDYQDIDHDSSRLGGFRIQCSACFMPKQEPRHVVSCMTFSPMPVPQLWVKQDASREIP
jgi:hypothetical protein